MVDLIRFVILSGFSRLSYVDYAKAISGREALTSFAMATVSKEHFTKLESNNGVDCFACPLGEKT